MLNPSTADEDDEGRQNQYFIFMNFIKIQYFLKDYTAEHFKPTRMFLN